MSADRATGFTLLEVVVALAIAGLALVVLFRAGGDGRLAVDTSSRAQEAVERARSHLAAVGRDVALLQGESSGDDGGGYHWRLRVSPVAAWQLPEPNGAPPVTTTLFDIEVAIDWHTSGRDRAVVLKSERLATTGAE